MTIRVECPSCGAAFKAPAEAVGRRAKCRKCGEAFTLREALEVYALASGEPAGGTCPSNGFNAPHTSGDENSPALVLTGVDRKPRHFLRDSDVIGEHDASCIARVWEALCGILPWRALRWRSVVAGCLFLIAYGLMYGWSRVEAHQLARMASRASALRLELTDLEAAHARYRSDIERRAAERGQKIDWNYRVRYEPARALAARLPEGDLYYVWPDRIHHVPLPPDQEADYQQIQKINAARDKLDEQLERIRSFKRTYADHSATPLMVVGALVASLLFLPPIFSLAAGWLVSER